MEKLALPIPPDAKRPMNEFRGPAAAAQTSNLKCDASAPRAACLRVFVSSCQRKVEMSGFSQDRNVRFYGLLQGCSAGTWYLVCFCSWVWLFIPRVLEAVGRKDLRTAGLVRGKGVGA